jgi:multiple sugar transport system substrate-binding protein
MRFYESKLRVAPGKPGQWKWYSMKKRYSMKKLWAVPVVAVAVLTSCTTQSDNGGSGGGGGESVGDGVITVWTLEDVQDRIDKTKDIAAAFTQKTGTKVEVVPVAEDQFDQVLTAAAADGKLPDVIAALGLAGVQELNTNQLLNTDMSAEVVTKLGADTFSKNALALTQDGDTQLGVPSDAWPQLLLYRKDLFDAAGLAPPTSYDTLRKAAETLNSSDIAGITAATAAGDSFTQQTFEYLALPNDCQLVDDTGKVTLDSSQCVDTFTLYDDLMTKYSVSGNQDVDTTRATYFAGKAAMVIWSSFILDEMAGLRNDALPTCPQCKSDPAFLAKNTGVVGALEGDSGKTADYGEVSSWAPTVDADPETADFITYMMTTAYVDWLGLAPEGKIPVRLGTADDPTKYTDAWGDLKAGVDKLAPLSEVYSPDVLNTIVSGSDSFERWGLPEGQGALVGATLGSLPVPKVLNEMVTGGLSPEEAAQQATSDVQEISDKIN